MTPLLNDQDAGVRREAATTLGKIGAASAVPHLINQLESVIDRSEEHAVIYALIEINQPDELVKLISGSTAEKNSKLGRAALIALDQMDAGSLNEDTVAPLLDSDDASLSSAAWHVIKRHPEWKRSAGELSLIHI